MTHRLSDEDFAAQLATSLRREGLTMVFDEDKTQADHIFDLIEQAMTPTQPPVIVVLSKSGHTATFSLLTENPKDFAHHNAYLNNKTSLAHIPTARAAGRYIRVLRGGQSAS